MNKQPSERGQALVLIIFALVGLMGFAALAVDGGRVYAEKRRTQNAADAAAYAAALAASAEGNFMQAALDQLMLNDFHDLDPNSNPGSKIDIEVHSPPISGPYLGDGDYYQVLIRSAVDQVFSQFIFNGPLEVTAEAVAKSRPIKGIFPGNAVHATSSNSCKAIYFHGSGDTYVSGGNIFSNSDRTGVPSSCDSGVQDGGGNVDIDDGGLVTVGTFTNGSGTVTAEDGVNQYADPQPLPDVPMPDCSGLTPRSYTHGSVTLQPGIYAGGIRVTSSGTELTLAPGMYCLDDDLYANGGKITGKGVMFVMRHGEVNLSGNTSVSLTRPNHLVDASGQQWGGMLIYMPYANDDKVFLGGGSGSIYSGTIFAPGPRTPASQDKCIVEGNGTTLGLKSNLICYNVKIGGSASVTILYKEKQNYQMPPMIELSQ